MATKSDTVYFGKSRLNIQVTGCTECGTEYSTGWSVAEVVEVKINNRKPISVTVSICDDCKKKNKK